MDQNAFLLQRHHMIETQIKARGVSDSCVIQALYDVPRHFFVLQGEEKWAYTDYPLSIGYEQTISQPYMVAYMTEKLALTNTDLVLEIGTGSGYQTAILAKIAKHVYTVERIPPLQKRAKETLETLNILNVEYKLDDGHYGWDEFAPFNAIIVTAAAQTIPKELINQLAIGGRMVIPVGEHLFQELILITKKEKDIQMRKLFGCRFVPLVKDK